MFNEVQWGKEYFSCDYRELSFALYNNFRVIVLDDDTQKYKRMGCVMMSMLLPPYAAVEAEINGNYDAAANIYLNHLNDTQCINIFAALSVVLYAGQNIMFFISPDEANNLQFANIFNKFKANMLGFPGGNIQYPDSGILSMNPVHIANRMDIMYGFNLVPFDRYCMDYPFDMNPNVLACNKMAYDINDQMLRSLPMPDLSYYCKDIITVVRKQHLEAMRQSGSSKLMPFPVMFLHDMQRNDMNK